MVSKKSKKSDMVLGKMVTIFDWEWGLNSAHRDRQKILNSEEIPVSFN